MTECIVCGRPQDDGDYLKYYLRDIRSKDLAILSIHRDRCLDEGWDILQEQFAITPDANHVIVEDVIEYQVYHYAFETGAIGYYHSKELQIIVESFGRYMEKDRVVFADGRRTKDEKYPTYILYPKTDPMIASHIATDEYRENLTDKKKMLEKNLAVQKTNLGRYQAYERYVKHTMVPLRDSKGEVVNAPDIKTKHQWDR